MPKDLQMQISDTNMLKVKKRKVRTGESDPEAIFSWRQIPISKARVEDIMIRLMTYPKDFPEENTIGPFYRSQRLARTTYYDLLAKYPRLKEIHEEVMRELGERLWNKAVNTGNWRSIHHMLYSYAPEFHAADIHHSNMRESENKNRGIVIVERDKSAYSLEEKE